MSTIPKIEALLESIANLNGCFSNPESEAYRLRSPLLVRSFARPGKHESTGEGKRIFPSMLAGYRAAVFDLEKKLSGQSRAGLKPTDRLENLLGVYEIKAEVSTTKVVNFLRRALNDQSITKNTPLEYFLKDETHA